MTSLSSKFALLLVAGLVAAGCSMAPTAEESVTDDMAVEEVEMMEYKGDEAETTQVEETMEVEETTEEVMEQPL